MTSSTSLKTNQYHRLLIECGVTAQGNDAQVIAAAIARTEEEGIPPNRLQQKVIRQWEVMIRRSGLWRFDLLNLN